MPRKPKGTRTRCHWTPREDEILRTEYKALGINHVHAQMPHRTYDAVKARAKMLGLAEKRKVIRIDSGSPEAMQDEKELILDMIRFLAKSICHNDADNLKKSMALIDLAAERNSPEWFWIRRSKLLGFWCEMFIRGYEYQAPNLKRDDFLDADGVFIGKGGETMTYHGRGRR